MQPHFIFKAEEELLSPEFGEEIVQPEELIAPKIDE